MKTLLIIVCLLSTPALAAAPSISLCSYDCREPLQYQLSADSWQRITALFDQQPDDEDQQRLQLAQALALMERDIIRRLAVEHTQPDSSTDEASRHQLADQLGELFSNQDETRNTGKFIGLLQDQGLLSQYVLRRSEERSNLLGMTQSATIIQSRKSGELYAVDATSSGFGEAPLITPLQQWKNGTPIKKLFSNIRGLINTDDDTATHETGNESK